jgi:integrase
MKLSDKTIRTLACPAGKTDTTFWDEGIPGFGLRVRASGARTWTVMYEVDGRGRKISLGSPAIVPAAAARAKAKDIMAARRLGGDPAGDKTTSRAEAATTIGALLPRYLVWKAPRLKPKTVRETTRHLNKCLRPLHREPITAVTRAMIARRLTELSASNGSGEATRARASWSAFFMWACREGLIESNPVAFTNPPREPVVRDRAVTDPELGAIWRALDGDDVDADYAAIVRLLILTGARRDEITSLRRGEIDIGAALITLPGARVKNSREHVIPLSAPARAILAARLQHRPDRDLVFGYGEGPFSGFAKAKKELDAKLGPAVAPWRLHDFRRSISTALHERFDVPPHIVETILGHVGGHKSGVGGVYNKALYLDQRRAALERWAAHVMQLAGNRIGRPRRAALADNVVALTTGV